MGTSSTIATPGRLRFAKNLRRIRRAKDITQEQLAEAADIHHNYVSEVERGLRNIGVDNIWKLAKALNVSIAELFVDEQ